MFAFAILVVCFGAIAAGGEALLRGGIGLSRVLGVPALLTGLIVVSIGAAAPAIAIVLQAAAQGASGLVVSSIVGVNLFDILLVLGLAAAIRPIPASPKIVFRDGGVMLAFALALALMARTGVLMPAMSAILLCALIVYVVLGFVTDWRRPAPLSLAEARARGRSGVSSAMVSVLLIALGLLCLYFGSYYAVESGAAISRISGLSPSFVGLVLFGGGLGLPVLATAALASARGMSNTIAAQVFEANIWNSALVLGLVAAVRPVQIAAMLAHADVLVLMAASGLVVAFMLPGWRMSRGHGMFLILCYAGYVAFVVWREGLAKF